ncbi:MAG TPA: hypothetical protein VJV79_11680 [Polyangiaceae bacterium]|nr:hypothetical protein [Polyangiaceae bacterium]
MIEPAAGSGLSGGLGLSETKLNSTAAREIWIQGRVPGRYLVSASRGGVPVVPLEAEVFPEKVVKIAFYIMPDCVGNWDVSKLTELANAIWFPQANVRLEFLGAWTPESATSQFRVSGPIDLSQAQLNALYEYGNNWAANLLVYFGGRKIAGIRGYSTNAITAGNKTYVDTSTHRKQDYAKMGRTLAHEIGHAICPTSVGHDGKPTDLMFATNKSGGTRIRRTRVRQVIR